MAPDVTSLLNWVEPVIRGYGYYGVAAVIALETLGLPLPGETMLIAAAVLSGRHVLDPTTLGISAWAGAILGDNASYLIGRYGGFRLLQRHGSKIRLTTERLTAAQSIYRRYGALIVVAARYLAVCRQLNGLLAGGLSMRWRRFAVCDAVGTGLWVGGWVLAGYFAGNEISTLLQVPPIWWLVGLGLAITAASVVIVAMRRWRRSKINNEYMLPAGERDPARLTAATENRKRWRRKPPNCAL